MKHEKNAAQKNIKTPIVNDTNFLKLLYDTIYICNIIALTIKKR